MTSHGVARDQLIAFVERVERIEADIKELNADKSDVYAEARSLGFDVKVLKKVVAKRRMDSAERDEQDAIFEMYWDAIHGSGLVHARVHGNVEEFAEDTATNNKGEPNEVATHATSNAADAVSEIAATSNGEKGNNHERGSQRHVRRADGEQRDAARVSRPDGRGEGSDEGDQGQGAGASGPDRSMRAFQGTVDREDEDGRSCHVGGEARHEITQSDDDAFAAVKGKARLANVADVEPSSSEPIATAYHGDAEANSGAMEVPRVRGADNTGGEYVATHATRNAKAPVLVSIAGASLSEEMA